MLVASWSAWGTGSYLRRLLVSHLIGAIVGFALLLAILIQESQVFEDWKSVLVLLISIAPASLAVQSPFLLFRICFGWQYVLGDGPPSQPYSLKDIFTFTFLVAASFAAPQIAWEASREALEASVTDTYELTEVNKDGTLAASDSASRNGLAESRLNRQVMRSATFGSYLSFAIAFAVGSLLNFPIVLLMFTPKSEATGCYAVAFYVFGLAFLLICLIGILSGSDPAMIESIFYILFTSGLFGGAVAIPLSVSRYTGFRLVSYRRHRSQLTRGKIVANSSTAMARPIDPLGDE